MLAYHATSTRTRTVDSISVELVLQERIYTYGRISYIIRWHSLTLVHNVSDSHPPSVAAEQIKMLSAPVSLYPLKSRQGWVHLLAELYFLCTAAVHVRLCFQPALRYLWSAVCGMKVRPPGLASHEMT
jgi:hypothetical protein